MSKRPSRGELRSRRQEQEAQSNFIGREQELARFRENLQRPFTDPAFTVVFTASGQGGVGKTTLLRQWRNMAEAQNYHIALLDETNVRDVVESMARLADQLTSQGGDFKRFTKQYTTFRTQKEELELGPDAPRGAYGYAAATLTRTALAVSKTTPVGALFAGVMDEGDLVNRAASWADHVRRKLGKEEAKLVLDPIAQLTPLFLEDLDALLQKRPLAILIDTYEATGPILDDWLTRLLSEEYGRLPLELLILIAGRDPVGRAWHPLADICHSVSLEPFAPGETARYLAAHGVVNPAVQEMIVALSGHLPLLVSLLASNAPQTVDEVAEVNSTAVERFLQWEPDPLRRRVAQEAAVAQTINRDVLALLAAVPPEQVDALFAWLVRQPFVLERAQGWQYHDVVRPHMLRHLRRYSPQRWGELHAQLGDYYAEQQNDLGLTVAQGVDNPRWLACTLPQIYHRLCQYPERNLVSTLGFWLELWQASEKAAEQLAAVLERAGQDSDTPALRTWYGRLHRAYEAWQAKDWPTVQNALAMLTAQTELTVAQQAVAWAWLGALKFVMGQHEAAMPDYDHAIKLDPDFAWVWGSRGQAKRKMGEYEAAVADFDRAIELDPDAAWPWGQRGEAKRLMGQYEGAVADFDRAIELDPTAWKLSQRGEAKWQMGQYEAAVADFDHAIELEPIAWKWGQRGEAKRLMGEYEAAVADFDRAIELDPDYAWAWGSRGQAKQAMKQYEAAVIDYDRAIELNPDVAWVWGSRGAAKLFMGQYKAAVVDYDRTIELDPTISWPFSGRGECYLHLHQYPVALADFTHAAELSPESNWYSYSQAVATLLMGDPAASAAHLQTALGRAQASLDQAYEPWVAFNHALYQLVAGDPAASEAAYRATLAQTPSALDIRDAIHDLENYRTWFPAHTTAVEPLLHLLQTHLTP